jgi:hypothetical protein
MDRDDVVEVLEKPIAQRLLGSSIPVWASPGPVT